MTARASDLRIAPVAIRLLVVDQISYRVGHRRVVGSSARKQANQSPRGLRGGTGALPLGRWRIVTQKRFAEAAVGLLHGTEPDHRTLAILASSKRNGFERAQNSSRPINVIHAPATEPRAIAALILQQKLHGPLNDAMFGGPAEAAKALHHACGHVSGGGIDHGVVIGKRNIAEKLAVVVAVEGAPTAIAILHAQKPLN